MFTLPEIKKQIKTLVKKINNTPASAHQLMMISHELNPLLIQYANLQLKIKIVDWRDKQNYLKCDTCEAQDETVRDTICPYANEIYEEKRPMTLCSECYNQRAEDI
jgi:hypothetical protein